MRWPRGGQPLASRNSLPSRPARSWMNCQATRPERAPRVIDHSSASRTSSASVDLRGRSARHSRAPCRGTSSWRAVVEAEPQAEAVRQRDLLLHRLGRVDGGRALVLDHVARHQVPAVGGGVEQHVAPAVLRCRLRAPPSATCRTCRRLSKERSSQNTMKRRSARAQMREAGAAARRCPRGGSRRASGRAALARPSSGAPRHAPP